MLQSGGKTESTPQVPRGMHDFTPEEMHKRNLIIEKIKKVFSTYGYEPIETPALEYWETLSGKYGDEGEKLIYRLTDRGGRELGLRYDLTVPLARFAASHPEIPRPFKRYQIQPVWRADKPQRGRFREFYQCDFDIVGSSSLAADAEIIAVLHDSFSSLAFADFKIRVNSRKLIRALAEKLNLAQGSELLLARALDKLERDGLEGVLKETESLGLSSQMLKTLKDFLSIQSADFENALSSAAGLLRDAPSTTLAFDEMRNLFSFLKHYSIEKERVLLDFSLARGLDYYTGPIFEAVVPGSGVGSVAGGGRYDTLLGIFSKEDVPATGASLGLDRIVTIFETLKSETFRKSTVEILVTRFSNETEEYSYKLANTLRRSGFSVDLYLGDISKKGLRAQLGYAQQKGIPFVLIAGPDEVAHNKTQLKIMETGEQLEIPFESLHTKLKELLKT
ncbi:MAG: histidine--tRNA ligase [Planctomycetota bacterium]|nr:histidine--tRNA ligase [Planctomycetota bacterium]